jgi:hypothetical protein
MSKFFDFGDEAPKKPIVVKPIKKVDSKPMPTTFDRDKVFNTPGYTFKFGGKTYECIGEDKDFQITQFRFIVETSDWITMRNRIKNQLLFGPNIKII